MPQSISVVVNTYECPASLDRAIRSVLAQDLRGVEVVVADDGSTVPPDHHVHTTFPDHDIRVVTHPNGGLSASRNLGLRETTGDYVLFLDDDDELAPGAIAALREHLGPGVGVVSGVAEVFEDGSAEPVEVKRPRDQGPETDHQVVCNVAGSWLASREALEAVGGFDEALRCNHQREMFLRVLPWCVANGRTVRSTGQTVVRIHRQPPSKRPRNDPDRLQTCLEYLLEKHAARLARNPTEVAALHDAAGVAAARNGRRSAARRHFLASLRARPTQPATLGRLLATAVPPLGRRVWGLPSGRS